jgi:hypothetical protein
MHKILEGSQGITIKQDSVVSTLSTKNINKLTLTRFYRKHEQGWLGRFGESIMFTDLTLQVALVG